MKTYKLLSNETILTDDYPIFFGYVYIIDNVFARSEWPYEATVGQYKKRFGVKEIRRCSLFGHDGAKLGDRVE